MSNASVSVSQLIVDLLDIDMKSFIDKQKCLVWGKEDDQVCSHCGTTISQGTHYLPVSVGVFFGDTRDLAAPSKIVCAPCAWLRTKSALHAMMNAVVVKDTIYKLRTRDHWAWLFLTPPEPPFVVMSSKAKLAHLAWRAVPTLDERLIYVRRDNFLFTIRPSQVRKMIDLEIAVQMRSNKKATLFRFMDRLLTEPNLSEFSHDAQTHLSEEERNEVALMTPGEYWACTMLLGNFKGKPTTPDMFDLNKIRP